MTPTLPVMLAQAAPLPDFSWTRWAGDGTLRAGLLLLAGVYLLGIGPLRKRFNLGPPVSWGKIACYLGGVFCLFIALEGPIHELSDYYLFSAHMVQHMLLIYAAPPLLLLGMPDWLLRPVLRLPGVFPVARAVTRPLPALLMFNIAFSAFHIPLYYNTIVGYHPYHIAAHLAFIALAVITWWPLLSPMPELPRLSYPLQMLYVFAQTFSGFIVGAFVTNAPRVLYSVYLEAPRTWGLSPLDDQKLGGLIMWVIGGVYLLMIYSIVFFAWARAEGVDDDVAVPVRARARARAAASPNGTRRALTRTATSSMAAAPAPRAAPADPSPEPSPASGVPVSRREFGEPHVVRTADDPSRLN
jgi:putative membrane protein